MTDFNWKRYTKAYLIAAAFFFLAAAFYVGVWYGDMNRPGAEKVLNVFNQGPPEQYQNVDFGLFWDAWSRLEEKYVDRAKINRQKMVYGAISGLARSLNDPYTEFFPPAESKQFQEDVKGSFGGIGAEIGIRKSVLTIIAPLKGNPAERAGLKAGDQILKINDTPTNDLTLGEAVHLIRGEPGTHVRLAVFREGAQRAKEYTITRDVIRVEILTTEKLPDRIFLIKLNQFTESAGLEFRRAMNEFAAGDSEKVILDVRNDPGGFLNVAVDIASWWVKPGEVVARERFADDKEELYRSHGYRMLENIPTVVLINEGSASASEIVAGALRDHSTRVKLVGVKTFGKGSVQEIVDLPKSSSLKITIAKWLTPKGTEINGKGLEPDIKVEIPQDKELKPGEDPALQKAIEVVKGL